MTQAKNLYQTAEYDQALSVLDQCISFGGGPVTAAQVQAAAKKWFTDDNRLVLEYLPANATQKSKGKK